MSFHQQVIAIGYPLGDTELWEVPYASGLEPKDKIFSQCLQKILVDSLLIDDLHINWSCLS